MTTSHFSGSISGRSRHALHRHDWADGHPGALSARVRAWIVGEDDRVHEWVLKSAFRQAVRWRMLGEDPCADVDPPRVKRKEMEALSVEECRRFLSVAEKSEWYALFALALTTGMRSSEYLALKWSDIDWQRGAVSVSLEAIQVTGAGLGNRSTRSRSL